MPEKSESEIKKLEKWFLLTGLYGRVLTSGTDEPVPGAIIVIYPSTIPIPFTDKEFFSISRPPRGFNSAISSRRGFYRLPAFPGKYVAIVRKRGYTPLQKNVTVKKLVPTHIDFHLKKIPESYYIGNKRTKELHQPDCPWVGLMSAENKVIFRSIHEALEQGYNGCYWCMREIDTG